MCLERAHATQFATRIAAFAALHLATIQALNRVENRITVFTECGIGVKDIAHSAHGSTAKGSQQRNGHLPASAEQTGCRENRWT
jgi:hypothetical protein